MLKLIHDDSIKNLKIHSVVSGMVTVGYLIWFFESIIDDIERDTEDDDQIQLKWINEIRQELRSIEDIRYDEMLSDDEKSTSINKHIIKLDEIFDCEEEEYLDMVEQFEYIISDDYCTL